MVDIIGTRSVSRHYTCKDVGNGSRKQDLDGNDVIVLLISSFVTGLKLSNFGPIYTY